MRTVVLLALISLTACGSPSNDTVGAVTRSEAQALNDAATMVPATGNEAHPK